jgi:hypothetical protein
LLKRIDRYAARLEGELHLSVSRSDALLDDGSYPLGVAFSKSSDSKKRISIG